MSEPHEFKHGDRVRLVRLDRALRRCIGTTRGPIHGHDRVWVVWDGRENGQESGYYWPESLEHLSAVDALADLA